MMDTLRERHPAGKRAPLREPGGTSPATTEPCRAGLSTDIQVTVETLTAGHVNKRSTYATSADEFHPTFVDAAFVVRTVPYARSKRAFDVVFSASVLLFGAPFLMLLALLVKCSSRGPVIFKQLRVGRGGRFFNCYKFRSMCADAEDRKSDILHLNEATGPVFKIKNDPRITPIGAVLRKFSLDEFPQFYNVLKGDMSVVGPRPPIPSEVDAYGDRERSRLAVHPGITCLWQINGRSDLSFTQWMDLDMQYIDAMSFASDLGIVARTVPAVLRGSGAH